ncbi:hypothetical protein CXG46_21410 [Nocardioides alpinus]|uniref:Uncharacterized protein n=1 Tax=Nocardioides alpinus TaxID=748909 RepID=A0ABX4QUD5_9ACTN|nr:hypothetical protein CXG46_21410 [Nocardioides alpinus]
MRRGGLDEEGGRGPVRVGRRRREARRTGDRGGQGAGWAGRPGGVHEQRRLQLAEEHLVTRAAPGVAGELGHAAVRQPDLDPEQPGGTGDLLVRCAHRSVDLRLPEALGDSGGDVPGDHALRVADALGGTCVGDRAEAHPRGGLLADLAGGCVGGGHALRARRRRTGLVVVDQPGQGEGTGHHQACHHGGAEPPPGVCSALRVVAHASPCPVRLPSNKTAGAAGGSTDRR